MINKTKNTTIKQENKSRYRNKSRTLNRNKTPFYSIDFNKRNTTNLKKTNNTNSKVKENKIRDDKFYSELAKAFLNNRTNNYNYRFVYVPNKVEENEKKNILDIFAYILHIIYFPVILFEKIKK